MGILLGQWCVHRILREVHHGLCLVRSVNIYCDREVFRSFAGRSIGNSSPFCAVLLLLINSEHCHLLLLTESKNYSFLSSMMNDEE